MAEVEVNYSSVVFKSNKPRSEAKEREETVYSEVKVHKEKTTRTQDEGTGIFTHKKAERSQQLACCFGTLSAILILCFIGVCVYLVSLHESDVSELLGENHNLTNINKKLSSDYEDLMKVLSNLAIQHADLTQALKVQEHEITNLTAENQNLLSQSEEFRKQNQKLETEMKLLTKQIENMAATQNELNISRAQWSIDAYCPNTSSGRTCKKCQDGWLHNQSSCYAYNDHARSGQRGWVGAREDCRGKSSDLAVALDTKQKTYIKSISHLGNDITGYWIGLRAEKRKWKWIDGTELTNQDWIAPPVDDDQCVVSLQNQGWKSVSCEEENAWICEKAALSV